MAVENSCESDYLYSKYIAEFWCTNACLWIAIAGVFGVYLTSRRYGYGTGAITATATTTTTTTSSSSGTGGKITKRKKTVSSSSRLSIFISQPGNTLFFNITLVGLFGAMAHGSQIRLWEALETATLEHFTVLVALLSSSMGWGFRLKQPVVFWVKLSLIQMLLLSPFLYFGNVAFELATALAVAVTQVSMVKIWMGHRALWERYPRILIIGAQVSVVVCVVVDMMEMWLGCEWEVELDYNDNVLNDPNLHNHLHAASLVFMGIAMYLASVFLDFAFFALKDTAIRLHWMCGVPYVVTVAKNYGKAAAAGGAAAAGAGGGGGNTSADDKLDHAA
uniref:Uncharacterized protein n=1 Tax=Lotharella oceanica TaxID=641309 RepID=A0A7S2U170_9EUKA|mmetsp:Transcript_5578/g.11063  ORF Transcript_5578/g.11063 Transcript_5578/m.11063 type:complete len:334 (+) Transcript_5578:366-1367(+)|eukprot:CAMPEP_0170180156 /NCGR_PEP_ID=MMETSP0040_2-20121228/20807_1 /TAXON_ID=641309 /ORGANISM="Lotharella oceanica, Strain CCMP622" /LENGTH=333 /DNA_ID=CAMNT_0010424653 /DNA_START=362 /DNA_END=1363 /DNA_ORIENTATION=-